MKFSRVMSTLSPTLLLAAALPASAATLSVGPGASYKAPCAALTVAKSGDVIEIAGNTTYSGDVCYVAASNITIRGVNGRPKIDAAGKYANAKGTWVIGGSNVTVENVEMYGSKVPDLNGAALRLEGTNFTLRQSYLHDNENGILSGVNTSSDILIEYTEFSHNGHGDSQSHNLYVGNARSLTFRYNYSHDANAGHNLKSRALTNMIAYNRFSSSGLGAPSYEIDLPNAGTSYIIGNIIQQPAVNNNSNIIAYGAEGATNPGQDLYVVNNTFLNDYGSGGTFVMVKNVTKPALIQNNIFAGVGSVTNQTNATLKTNYSAAAPGFINRAAFDLHPTANAQVINAGSAPGTSASGISLVPTGQYKATAYGEARPVSGNLDIGAFEAATASSTTPAPAPAPTPAPAPAPAPTPAPTPSPAPSTPETWTACASQWGTCSFSGARQVRYGANGVYVTKTLTGPVACTNAVFGDPLPGISTKACSISGTAAAAASPAPTTPPATVAAWTACASQWGTCSFSGTRQVRYGANGVYVTKTVTGPVACTNAVFGDPLPGISSKSCSYAS
jgi:hypothetical protein